MTPPRTFLNSAGLHTLADLLADLESAVVGNGADIDGLFLNLPEGRVAVQTVEQFPGKLAVSVLPTFGRSEGDS